MTNKEGKPEMVGGKFNCPNYSMKGKKKSILTSIESLPDELVFDILLLLSPQDIYNGPMFVCKKWCNIVRTRKFISAHAHRSTPGLIIQNAYERTQPVFVQMRQGQIYVSNLNYESRGRIWASCNGLVLESDFDDSGALYIVNPVTQQRFALPPFACEATFRCYSNMAYAEVSKQYKVVLMYSEIFSSAFIQKSAILTVGVDESWRELPIKPSYYQTTLATDGFIHWRHFEGTRVLNLNVESETITETPVITNGYGHVLDTFYSSTGSSITIFDACSKFSWEVLTMKSGTGEWTKVAKIDMESRVPELKHLVFKRNLYLSPDYHRLSPVGWLYFPEVLVLCIEATGVCIIYYVRTQEIDFLKLDYRNGHQRFVVHRNSLEWLGGC